MGISKEAESIMNDRFGKDSVISLATCADNMPAVRYVNAYYDNNAFYVLTYALSNKMKHIEKNPNVAIAGDWFTARILKINLTEGVLFSHGTRYNIKY